MMPAEEYFVVVNDNPMFGHSGLVVTGPSDDLDLYRDREEALDRRDTIREEYDNPDINVYRMTVHEGPVEREEQGDEQ
jgi:hypothetical protein